MPIQLPEKIRTINGMPRGYRNIRGREFFGGKIQWKGQDGNWSCVRLWGWYWPIEQTMAILEDATNRLDKLEGLGRQIEREDAIRAFKAAVWALGKNPIRD